MQQFISLLIILPLSLWVSCEDESKNITTSIYGLWEWKYLDSSGTWLEISPSDWWSNISAESYSERFLENSNSDSSCFTDWEIIKDSLWNVAVDWNINGEDSATLIIYLEPPIKSSYKVHDDTLYWYFNDPEPSVKAVKIQSYDFTPVCE